MEYLPILLVFVFYFIGLPVAYALFASALVYFTFYDAGMPADLVLQRFITATASFPLLAIPFFIMAGAVMNYGGISRKLMALAAALTGHLTGGLAQVNVVLSTLMGGVSGSANADAAMQSKILVPQMVKQGYSPAFSAAITAASSAISAVIPPGIVLIIYALIAQVSVVKMFIAGYVPGLLMAIALMVTVRIMAKRRGYAELKSKPASANRLLRQFLQSFWSLALPISIVVGLRFGWFTPTEAGAMAVLAASLIGGFIHKELSKDHFIPIIKDTLFGTSSVVLIIVAASVFGYYLTWEQIPQRLTEWLVNFTDNPYILLLLLNILLLLLGMLLEGGAALIILAPLVVPVAVQLGIDPIHFGVVLIVNVMIGGITPPFGTMMFTTCSVTQVPLSAFVAEVWPYLLALICALLLLTYCPVIVLWLPNWLL